MLYVPERRRPEGRGAAAWRRPGTSRWARRPRSTRGAVLVEAAICIPLLAVVVMGVAEFGLLFKDANKVAGAVRNSSRVGTRIQSPDAMTDYAILQAVKADSGKASSDIQKVIIYRSDPTMSSVSMGCQTATASSSALGCNIYGQTDLSATAASFDTSKTTGFDPASRDSDTYVGVWVEVRHHWISGLFGPGKTFRDFAVMRQTTLSAPGVYSSSGDFVGVTTSIPGPTTTVVVVGPDGGTPDPLYDKGATSGGGSS